MRDITDNGRGDRQGANGKGAQRDARGRFLPDQQARDAAGRFAAPVGAFSPAVRILEIDKRTTIGRLLLLFRDELTEHLGGAGGLSFPQRMLVRMASVRAVRLTMLEAAVLDGAASDAAETRWSQHASALRRDLQLLGMERPEEQAGPRLRDILAGRGARH